MTTEGSTVTTATIMPGAKPLGIGDYISTVKISVDGGLAEIHLRGLTDTFITVFLESPDAKGKHTFRADISNAALLTTSQWHELNELLQSDKWTLYVDQLLAFHFVRPAAGTTKPWNLG